jgi:hypothetical protein
MKWLMPTQLKKPNACAKNLIALEFVLYFANKTGKFTIDRSRRERRALFARGTTGVVMDQLYLPSQIPK